MKHKRSGRVTALLLSAVLTLCLLPLPVRAAGAEAGVQLGDYIQLGRYDGEPILWRCVSVDENGPLMLSDRVLCDSMPYDAQTSENSVSGSHRRSGYRSKYGSNHWRDSDMRSWLNSDADAGQVKWLCGNPPKDGYIMGGGAYDGKAGFLNDFTRDEAAAIKTVTQRAIVSHPEYTAGYIDAPGADLPYNTDIGSVADGYEGAHYENITDKVFLLDVKQLHTVYENLGGYYIGQNRSGVSWNYWLRTPVTDCNHDMRYVSPQGSIGRDAPYKGYYGVRPAFYLDAAYYAVISGSGTAADPYVGAAPGKPADSTPLSPAERDTGDGNWDVDTETYLQVEMSERYTTDREYANPTIPVYVIQKPRSDTENMVILFCAEGYTKSQQADFVKDVQGLWRETLKTEPYRSMADRFNVYALCTASKDGFNGSSTFFQANKNGISVNYGGWRNHILERIIGTAFIEKIHDAHIPNTTKPEADEYRQYDYVYEHINQFVVLANSGEYFGGSHDEIKSGIHYILAAAKHNDSPFILRHELGHGLFHLGDEYATSTTPVGEESYRASLNMSHTADPALVKWKKMLGFRNTYSCPHRDNSYVYNSSAECIMRDSTKNEFCDVCTLQGTKRMSQLIADPPALYAAIPEVKLYTGSYRNPSENADAYRQAKSSGYRSYQQDRKDRLLSGSYKNRLSPSMKGREIELRTIVQNLSDTEEQTVTLRLWVQHSDSREFLAEKNFPVPVWSEKSKFWPKGALEYTGSNFDSGLVNCSLVYKLSEDTALYAGDTIGFEVVDGAGNILANDRTENQTYTAVTVRYALEDGTAMPNTAPSVLPIPTGASVNWQPPQTLNGHAFVKKEVSGSTVTFVYQETSEQPEVKTYTETVLTAPSGVRTMGEELCLSAQVTAAAEENTVHALQAAGLPVYTLQKMGNDRENLVLLLLGDGYTQDQQQRFLQEAREQLGRLMALEPYSRLAHRINVYAVPTVSNEAGLSSENNKLDTYFGLTTWYETKTIVFRNDVGGAAKVDAIKADLERLCLDEGATVDNIHMFVNTGADVGSASGIYSFSKGGAEDYAMAHELSHSVGKLGDEYGSATDFPNVSTENNIKWKEMMGYRSILAETGNASGVRIPTAHKCNMYQSDLPFCEVCRLALVRRMFVMGKIQNGMDLYVADPEVTTKHEPHVDSAPYHVTQENLMEKATSIHDLSLRTVIQNLSDQERTVKLVLGVVKANGEPREPLKEKTFTVPALTNKDSMEDACIYPTLTFDPIWGMDFKDGDRLVGEVRDAENGEVLATCQEPEYDAYQVDYLLEDRQPIPNTFTTQLLLPKGCTTEFIEARLPQRVGGHAFVRMEREGLALRLYYRQAAQTVPPAVDGGQVQFYVNGTPLGEAAAVTAGAAVLDGQPVSSLAGFRIGENVLTARFLGTAEYAASESTGVTLTVNKAAPIGAEQPKPIRLTSASYEVGGQAAALDGATTVDDGGTVTYQWYRAAGADSFNGTPITGETNAAYTPDTSAAGTYYYYVVATNTKTDGEGATTVGTTSNMAVITVTAPTAGGGSAGGGSATTPTKPETTTKPDGTKVETTTKPDGSSVTESTAPNGSTGTVKTDKNGQTEATAKLSAKALEDAKKSGEAVKAPVEVEASRNSDTAPTVSIELPKGAGETKVDIPVSNANSGTVAVLVHPDGTEEIVKNSLPTENGIQLTVNGGATVKIIDNSKDFADTQNHWAKDEVSFVAARELFNGIGNNLFGVSGEMTRGMVNTVLARLAGANTEGGAKWYDKGTEWARTNGISDGTNPTAPVTREQLAAMLYRFAGAPAVSGALNFNDANAVSEYARSALLWVTQNGILNGVGGNLAAPAALAERAQVAAMLARYLRSAG